MNVLQRIEHFQKVWAVTLPHLALPCPEYVARWAVYPTKDVEDAILRTARRFAPSKITEGFDPQQAYRYVTAVAKSIGEQKGMTA